MISYFPSLFTVADMGDHSRMERSACSFKTQLRSGSSCLAIENLSKRCSDCPVLE